MILIFRTQTLNTHQQQPLVGVAGAELESVYPSQFPSENPHLAPSLVIIVVPQQQPQQIWEVNTPTLRIPQTPPSIVINTQKALPLEGEDIYSKMTSLYHLPRLPIITNFIIILVNRIFITIMAFSQDCTIYPIISTNAIKNAE